MNFSPSAYERWSNCTASVQAIALDQSQGVALADEKSAFADEGIASHELLALCMVLRVSPRELIGTEIWIESLNRSWLVDEEMGEETDKSYQYIMDYVTSLSVVWVEKKVTIGIALPNTRGTVDVAVLTGRTLHVFDHKYGKGVPVSVKGNGQLRLYVLGVMNDLLNLDERIDLTEIVTHIVQPRLNIIGREGITKHDIERFRLHVRETYLTAISAKSQFVAGEHCRFCPRKPYCKPLKESIFEKVFENMNPENFHDLKSPDRMSAEELVSVHSFLEFISAWTTNVKKYMESQALAGVEYPGLKVVEGRKGTRAWKDEAKAIEFMLDKGVEEEKIWKKTVVSPAQAENLIGRKKIGIEFKELVDQNEGKPILVPVDDPRPTMKQMLINEFED